MAQLLDIHGNPLRRETLREPQTARLAGLHREFAEHPARGLTPARLAAILQDAEQGNLQCQAELFADMEERDAHLYAEVSKRKRAVLGLDWRIEPPRNPTPKETADADYLEELLQDLDGWEELLLDLLDGIGHGYSAVEMEWQLYGREWLPKRFHHRPQGWFQLDRDNQDALRLRDLSGMGAELQPFGWLLHRPRARSGYVARGGLHRVLAWPYLFKHYATRDLAELLEIYGLPIRLGKYPNGTGDAEKATLLRAVTELGHSAAGIIPESMAIEFVKAAEGSSEPFLAMMSQCDASISKAVLGGTLTSQTSDSGGGAYALGKVHNEVRHDILAADARQLAGTLSRDLLWPLLTLNRPGDADARRAPRLVFDLREPADLTAMAQALPALVKIGVQVPASWAQDKLGIPLPAAGERVLGGGAAPAVLGARLPVRRAALASIVAPAYADQQALDQVLGEIPAAQLQQHSDDLLAPLLEALASGADEGELLGLLAEALPDMDDSGLTEALHRLLFAADAFGRLHAAAERGE